MTRIVLLILLVACQQPVARTVTNASCFASCSSSLECRDVISRCNYCYLGKCTSVLPADPLDAGVDAPGGTTP